MRCLAASGFKVSAIRCTSRGGYSITIEQLEARTRPERPSATVVQLEGYARPVRPPGTVEQIEARVLPERPSSVVSDTIMSLIKRHSIAGSYA